MAHRPGVGIKIVLNVEMPVPTWLVSNVVIPTQTANSPELFVHVFTDISDSDLLPVHSGRVPYLVVCLQHICSRPFTTSEENRCAFLCL